MQVMEQTREKRPQLRRIGDRLDAWYTICPVDGVVIEGRGVMDESYLTGEPFEISKTPGSKVLSGAINGETRLSQ
jgi:high-affinity K+ transport system ATPase subunit B